MKDYNNQDLNIGDTVIYLPWRATTIWYQECHLQGNTNLFIVDKFVEATIKNTYVSLKTFYEDKVIGNWRGTSLMKISYDNNLLKDNIELRAKIDRLREALAMIGAPLPYEDVSNPRTFARDILKKEFPW